MIAIHKSGIWSFRPEWEEYCKKHEIAYRLVDAYDSNIVSQLRDCSVFLFHHHHTDVKDYNFAKQLLFALEQSGLRVFPDFNTGWHFDDKLGQKYLLEAIEAPLVPTQAFYDKKEAKLWALTTSLPKVAKLRSGAGSNNVKLLKKRSELFSYIDKAFGKGFNNYNRKGDLEEKLRNLKEKRATFKDVLKSLRRVFVGTDYGKTAGKERSYVLFQDFIPNNNFDIRVITIGERAFAIKRPVRKNDFRASGSGFIIYDRNEIDLRCIQIAFEITNKLNAQCVAYDFVFDQGNNPLIVEINYGFAHRAYDKCPGYWDIKLNFIAKQIDPCGWIVENIISQT